MTKWHQNLREITNLHLRIQNLRNCYSLEKKFHTHIIKGNFIKFWVSNTNFEIKLSRTNNILPNLRRVYSDYRISMLYVTDRWHHNGIYTVIKLNIFQGRHWQGEYIIISWMSYILEVLVKNCFRADIKLE